MGGGKNGGGKTTTNTVAEPWSGVQPYLKSAYGDLETQFRQGPPQYYPGSTVAPMDPYTSAAIHAQAGRAMAGSPLTAAAQNQLTATMAGDYLDAGNPYFQGAVTAATRPVIDAWQKNILPGVDSSFASAGRYGSDAHTGALDQAHAGLSTAVGDIGSKMAADNYNRERQNQIQGMLYAPQLAQQDYFDINQLGASGSALDAYGQALRDADIERYNYSQNDDWLRTQDYITTLMGTPWGSSSTTRTPQPNAFASALGGAGQGAGIGSVFGPWGALAGGVLGGLGGLLGRSDARLKTDIVRVGALDNGLPVYRFRFREGGPVQIGVLAQDVETVRPDAVVEIGGVKHVDYRVATEARP